MNNATNFRGYEIETLRNLFNAVAPAGNWKLPVRAVAIGESLAAQVSAAIEFHVGGKCEVSAIAEGFEIKNAGYYANIGA